MTTMIGFKLTLSEFRTIVNNHVAPVLDGDNQRALNKALSDVNCLINKLDIGSINSIIKANHSEAVFGVLNNEIILGVQIDEDDDDNDEDTTLDYNSSRVSDILFTIYANFDIPSTSVLMLYKNVSVNINKSNCTIM